MLRGTGGTFAIASAATAAAQTVDPRLRLPEGEVRYGSYPETVEEAYAKAREWDAVAADPLYSEVAEHNAQAYRDMAAELAGRSRGPISISTADTGSLDVAIDIATEAINTALDVPIPVLGFNSVNDVRSDARDLSAYAISSINWLEGQYNAGRDLIDRTPLGSYAAPYLYTADFAVAGLSTIGRGVSSIPAAAADPFTSVKGFFVGAARTIDNVLVAENTSAITHIGNARNYVANASGRELATGGGNLAGNAVLAVGPTKFARATRFESPWLDAYEIKVARMANVRNLGTAGESAVGYIGRKQKFTVPGTTRSRIPDGVDFDAGTLSEVKNVVRLSYTQQLRDFRALADDRGLRFDLYVRRDAEYISGPLRRAHADGDLNLIYWDF